jgi:hypothetical protein
MDILTVYNLDLLISGRERLQVMLLTDALLIWFENLKHGRLHYLTILSLDDRRKRE